MTTIRQLFGTVLVVSVFWLCFTLMIMTYHEDLIRSNYVYEYEPISDENVENIEVHRKADEHAGQQNDIGNAQEKPLQDSESLNKEYDLVSNIPAYKNSQQRVNTIHNNEHTESKYDPNETSDVHKIDGVEEAIKTNDDQKLDDNTKVDNIQRQHDGALENEAAQNDAAKENNEIQFENKAEVNNAPAVEQETKQENSNAPAVENRPMEGNNDAHPAAAGAETQNAQPAEKEPDQINDTDNNNNKVLQENSESENKVQQDVAAPAENQSLQNNQGAPLSAKDMEQIQKQMQAAMKQKMPEEMGDVQMMVPNAEEIQKALAGGGNQPGLMVMPVQENAGENPFEALQKQMGAIGAGDGEGAENIAIPLDSLGGGANVLGNMNDLGAAGNAGNPFGNMKAFGGLGNPMLGNNGVGVVNPLAALLGAANNPALQFNMPTDDEAPPYKWEVDLDTIVKRAPRDAPGEMGEPVEVVVDTLSPEERQKYDEGEKQHAFNVYASDMISLRRRLKDPRDMACKAAQYTRQMPDTSVIICFHNEAWSVLVRTVFSILDRSPPHLIKEIILVDDKSELKELRKPLERYMAQLKKVKIVRTKKREGLIRARLLGVSVAKGTVLTFMDSHCEVHPGWLEPLLDRIAEDPTRVVCPVINQLNHATLRQDVTPAVDIGIFKLDRLEFTWGKMFSREIARRTSDTEPFRTPTMAGGLFSIARDYFLRMGKYDAGMDIWGAENLEMSFRVWMCGGSIEIHPCSHVGHIFRSRSPYDWGGRTIGEILRKNTVRLAEVWADEYKHYYYFSIGYNLGEYGDVSERKALRQKLHCTSFDTYVRNVYPELFPLPPKHPYAGEIRNEGQNLCIDSMGEKLRLMIAAPCHSMGGNQEVSSETLLYQFFGLKENGEIDREGSCVTKKGEYVAFTTCNGQTLWDYSEDRHLILRGTNDCLALGDDKYVKIAPCANNKNQQWIMTKRDV